MNKYEITFYIAGHRYSETIGATSASDVRVLILSKYPKATAINIKKI